MDGSDFFLGVSILCFITLAFLTGVDKDWYSMTTNLAAISIILGFALWVYDIQHATRVNRGYIDNLREHVFPKK